MKSEIKFWQASGGKLNSLPLDKFSDSHKEDHLRNLIASDASFLGHDLTIIGKEVTIPGAGQNGNGRLDLLAQTYAGQLVVIEFKRQRTTRKTVAQILDYASALYAMSPESLRSLIGKPENLRPLPEKIDPELILVASDTHPATDRIVRYLSAKGHKIAVFAFSYIKLAGGTELYANVVEASSKPLVRRPKGKSVDENNPVRPSLELIETTATAQGVLNQYRILRQALSLKWKEQRWRTNNGTVRYLVPLPRGREAVLFGMNVGGQRLELGKGILDVWVWPATAADFSGKEIGTVREELKAFDKTASTRRIGLKIKTDAEANALLAIFHTWNDGHSR